MSTEVAESPNSFGTLVGEMLAGPSAAVRRLELIDGEVIYKPGDASPELYYVHSGQIRIYQPGPEDSARLIEILGTGDWFGIEALTAPCCASTRALAVTKTSVSAVPVVQLMPMLARQPAIALEFIRQLAGKLQVAREDAGRLVFDDCNARLVETLLRFSGTAAATPHEGGAVMLNITHRQLAQAVGAARETISLALTQLRQQNLLRTGRNRLLFNPQTLRAFCQRTAKTEPEK